MPRHVVVDGSNIATEGRAMPSLKQLNEAVLAYMGENPEALVTVVVDASFGHRIDSREVAEFDSAVSNNEIVAPPAGAIGRGDAFVLSIANKVNATILSNDSYQEFHGTYPWLFDEGRLVGGKPVPHIGWVFVNRLPVRGPTSRKAMSAAKRSRSKVKVSAEASLPMPVPSAPPPGATIKAVRHKAGDGKAVAAMKPDAHKEPDGKAGDGKAAGGRGEAVRDGKPHAAKADRAKTDVANADGAKGDGKADASKDGGVKTTGGANDLLTFLNFVEHHQPGSSVNAMVESYSSHGAYVRVGEVRGYVPLSLMADPAPRSAREFMKLGESITLVVESFNPGRRSVDLAMPTMATIKTPPVAVEPSASEPKPKRTRKSAAPAEASAKSTTKRPSKAAVQPATPPPAPEPKKRAAKKAAAPEPATAAPPPAPSQPRPSKRTAKKAAPSEATPPAEPAASATAPSPRKRAAKKGAAAPAAGVSTSPAEPAPAPRRRASKAT